MYNRYLVVALGIDATGQIHPLGLWDGSTENATVCQGLLSNLQSRGLRADRSLLVILDGAKAVRSAVDHTFGRAACVQRCQVHKTRNILDYLPDGQRPWVHAILRRAYAHVDPTKARRLLEDRRVFLRLRLWWANLVLRGVRQRDCADVLGRSQWTP